MADFDLNQYLKENGESAQKSNDSFDLQSYLNENKEHLAPETQSNSKPSLGQSVLDKGIQGTTAGFSDELAGAGQAGLQSLSGLTGYSPGPKKGSNWDSIKAAYTQMRDQQRKQLEAEQKAHPIASTVANIAGGLAPAVLAGPSVKAATALGGLSGLGSSQEDLTTGQPGAMTGALTDVATGSTLGLGSGLIGKGLNKFLQPENLEVAGSKMASKAVGIKPTDELTSEFNAETGRMEQGSDIIKGIGKTAMEENALPTTGGAANIYNKSIEAINNNYKKLNPLIPAIQKELDPVLEDSVGKVGQVADKIDEGYDQFIKDIPQTSGKDPFTDKLYKVKDYYAEKLSNAEGNLSELVGIKRELQDAATSLKTNVYTDPNASEKSTEALMLKRMGGIVRQHIEDLAATVNPDAAEQLGSINKTLSNLYTYKDAARQLLNKPSSTIGIKDVGVAAGSAMIGHPILGPTMVAAKYGTELATGNPIGRLAQIGTAKGLNLASKAIDTPAGQLVQKAIVNTPTAVATNPWTQSLKNKTPEPFSKEQPTQTAASLYNATDDSLKGVAGKLSQAPGLKFYGDTLQKAIDNNDQGAKQRAVFLIMQHPNARKLVQPGKQ